MGAGKTTVGELLAGRLGSAYLDSDAAVEASTGATVREIFEARGEPAFRSEEARVLCEAISMPDRCVICVAGGAVLSAENRDLISKGGTVVWLRAPVEVLARRVGTADHRPLLGDDPRAALELLYVVRQPFYEELADIVVDVDTISPEAAVDKIVSEL